MEHKLFHTDRTYHMVFFTSCIAFDIHKKNLVQHFFLQLNNDEYWYFPENAEIIWMKKEVIT